MYRSKPREPYVTPPTGIPFKHSILPYLSKLYSYNQYKVYLHTFNKKQRYYGMYPFETSKIKCKMLMLKNIALKAHRQQNYPCVKYITLGGAGRMA